MSEKPLPWLRPMQKLRQVQRTPPGRLLDLSLATEAIGQHELFCRQVAQIGSELMFVDLHREIVFVFLKTEAAGHAAAAVIEDFRLGSHGLKELLFGVEADDRFLVTVSVNHDLLVQARWLVTVPCQKLRQREDLAVQTLGILVVRTQVEHLVPEDGQTTRLQANHRRSGFDRGLEVVQDIAQKVVGLIEESIVVQRPAAAERRARHDHAESASSSTSWQRLPLPDESSC